MTDWYGRTDEGADKQPNVEAELLSAAREDGEAPAEEEHRMSRTVGQNFRAVRAKYQRHLKLME